MLSEYHKRGDLSPFFKLENSSNYKMKNTYYVQYYIAHVRDTDIRSLCPPRKTKRLKSELQDLTLEFQEKK